MHTLLYQNHGVLRHLFESFPLLQIFTPFQETRRFTLLIGLNRIMHQSIPFDTPRQREVVELNVPHLTGPRDRREGTEQAVEEEEEEVVATPSQTHILQHRRCHLTRSNPLLTIENAIST